MCVFYLSNKLSDCCGALLSDGGSQVDRTSDVLGAAERLSARLDQHDLQCGAPAGTAAVSFIMPPSGSSSTVRGNTRMLSVVFVFLLFFLNWFHPVGPVILASSSQSVCWPTVSTFSCRSVFTLLLTYVTVKRSFLTVKPWFILRIWKRFVTGLNSRLIVRPK